MKLQFLQSSFKKGERRNFIYMKNGAKLLDETKTLEAKKKEAKLRAASEFGIFRSLYHNNITTMKVTP